MAQTHERMEGVGIDARQVSFPESHPLGKLSLAAAGVGAVALAIAWGLGGARFYSAYLTAYVYFLTLALGGLVFVLLQFVTRAGWSVTVRRLAEHVTGTLPLFLVLFVPVLVGMEELYPWVGATAGEAGGHGGGHDALLAHKAPWLNAGGFTVRAALYLVLWGALGWWLRRESIRQDRGPSAGDPGITRRLQIVSAPGLVLYGVTVTLASIDFVMSLDPHWYSTIFGVYIFSGATVGILALLIVLAVVLERRRGPLAGMVTPEHYHDLGKLLFGFVVFWAYIAFSQFMLIWYGNIPEETVWFAHRLEHGWKPVTLVLALGHFVLPFFYLLGRDVKRRRIALTAGAVWLLAFHYVDLYWLVMPSTAAAFQPHWLDPVCMVAVGGLFAGVLGRLMSRPALVPVADPRLPESLSFENM
ncbi:MAG: hypothetical protein PVG07_08235 [Acidobacteriota bacterium]|jgi:hypothetical protein